MHYVLPVDVCFVLGKLDSLGYLYMFWSRMQARNSICICCGFELSDLLRGGVIWCGCLWDQAIIRVAVWSEGVDVRHAFLIERRGDRDGRCCD